MRPGHTTGRLREGAAYNGLSASFGVDSNTCPSGKVSGRSSTDLRAEHEPLRRDLEQQISGEVRFDPVTRALYSTDASVYQIEPAGVILPKTKDDLVRIVRLCIQHGTPITLRGGGTSQAGQAIGAGVIVDTSKYLNRLLEVNAGERWARVEPGIVLDELNAQLKPHGLRFAPDISTASRATVGRHDGEQFQRRALGVLRQDHRSRAGAGGHAR
jgi:hypothetical protein